MHPRTPRQLNERIVMKIMDAEAEAKCDITYAIDTPKAGMMSTKEYTAMEGINWEELGKPYTSGDETVNSSEQLKMISNYDSLIDRNTLLLEQVLSEGLRHDVMQQRECHVEHEMAAQSLFTFNGKQIELSTALRQELRQYVATIASKYHCVGFHSFEHASHVMLSATKLAVMLRQEVNLEETTNVKGTLQDPWLHFCVSFAALIHDVDHKGVPNRELKAENDPLAIKYGSDECMCSYAEWNSVDIGLGILNREEFGLMKQIFDSHDGRLRVMVRDHVLCTDIANAERRNQGMKRWEMEFSETSVAKKPSGGISTWDLSDQKKAAGVIADQIMQVADVSHTMQHFDTFLKWNRRLYLENLAAYINGQNHVPGYNDEHPATNWYSSQIGFYDFYIIPLAKRLDYCGAFEHHNIEFAFLAQRNRDRWIEEGKTMTKIMVDSLTNKASNIPPPVITRSKGELLPNDQTENSACADSLGNEDDSIATDAARDDVVNSLSADSVATDEKYELPDGSERRNTILLREDKNDSDSIATDAAHDDIVNLPSVDSIATDLSHDGASDDDIQEGGAIQNVEAGSGSPRPPMHVNWKSKYLKDDVKRSVDAVVPKILIKQVLSSIQRQSENVTHTQEKSIRLKQAVAEYRKSGSLQRYRGALLFVDISGFTKLAQLYPIEDFKTFINQYFTKIIDLITSHGGDVVKFAGDALYAIWTSNGIESDVLGCSRHSINVAKCTACGIALSAECNDFKVSKSYCLEGHTKSRRRSSFGGGYEANKESHVMYNLEDKDARYEEREARLYVYCGIGEGIMGGVDLIAGERAEFFLIGQPLTDVAIAEGLAQSGELVISPSVHNCLSEYLHKSDNNPISEAMSDLKFDTLDDGFLRVNWSNKISLKDSSLFSNIDYNMLNGSLSRQLVDDMLVSYDEGNEDNAFDGNASRLMIPNLGIENEDLSGFEIQIDTKVTGDNDSNSLQQSLMDVLQTHHHEATRRSQGKFSAELRRVVIMFIKIQYEPHLSVDASEDDEILNRFQSIFEVISTSASARKGQIRQFISDDKGTVCILSFGLRGSAALDIASQAIDTAQEIRLNLSDMDIETSIGITVGKIFCGETGSQERYEYSLLGPSVNLSARLMSKGEPGSIYCDEQIKNSDTLHAFDNAGLYKVKGYQDLVPFFTPIPMDSEDAIRSKNKQEELMLRKDEMMDIINYIKVGQHEMTQKASENTPRAIVVSGHSGTGKSTLISGVLNDSSIRETMVVIEANRCYHDTPFYCWIPVITKIVLSCEDVLRRIAKMKKRKKSSIVLSFFKHCSFNSKCNIKIDSLVSEELQPYLGLVNDFVFQGFPVFKKNNGLLKMKDDEKISKCVEVLADMIISYITREDKPAIISIVDIDKADRYSKSLIKSLFNRPSSITFIGSLKNCENISLEDFDLSEEDCHVVSIFGKTDRICKHLHLKFFDKEAIYELFKWSLKNFTANDLSLLDNPSIQEKVKEMCGGIPRFAIELANVVNMHWGKEAENLPSEEERYNFLLTILEDLPGSKMEELICYRFDHLDRDTQIVLKVASIAGYDQYSFSMNLLEQVILALVGDSSGEKKHRVSVSEGKDLNNMFQGENFEQIIESLVDQNFLEEINADVGDTSSLDTELYRFTHTDEQKVIDGLMLEDQKRRIHYEVADYYKTLAGSEGMAISGEDESTQSSSIVSLFPTCSWQMLHITAVHYDLANAAIPAMIHYYDSSTELARLAIRDRAHGSLLSAFLMIEKRIREVFDNNHLSISEDSEIRRKLSLEMVQMITNLELSMSIKKLTPEHLKFMFKNDVESFNKCIRMLTKFGQSVGVSEKEGYIFGSQIYVEAIFFMILALKNEAFENLRLRLERFIGGFSKQAGSQESHNIVDEKKDDFYVEDLKISFPGFSGLLTFYRDAPIEVSKEQETFLANLFVAFTEETNETVHIIRTKCILSHLYLKHGDVERALEESEGIKRLYDHDKYSLELVHLYGMDWSLICITTMASVYIFRGEISSALNSIHFLEEQILLLDDFASSTKPMLNGLVSSLYLILGQFAKAAKFADGISNTSFPYFYKPSGLLQEALTKRLLELHGTSTDVVSHEGENGTSDEELDDLNILSILTSENFGMINHKRSMLHVSIETLSDRGIEAIQASICITEIQLLEMDKGELGDIASIIKKQMQYCQAGLAHLEQSLQQEDANCDDKRINYLSCLYQKSELLYWHKLLSSQVRKYDVDVSDDLFLYEGSELDAALCVLKEAKELSDKNNYFFMLMLVGARYLELGFNEINGEQIILDALEKIKTTLSEEDFLRSKECLNLLCGSVLGEQSTLPQEGITDKPPSDEEMNMAIVHIHEKEIENLKKAHQKELENQRLQFEKELSKDREDYDGKIEELSEKLRKKEAVLSSCSNLSEIRVSSSSHLSNRPIQNIELVVEQQAEEISNLKKALSEAIIQQKKTKEDFEKQSGSVHLPSNQNTNVNNAA